MTCHLPVAIRHLSNVISFPLSKTAFFAIGSSEVTCLKYNQKNTRIYTFAVYKRL